MLDIDRHVTAQRLEEYWEIQKGLSSNSAQVVQSVIEHFRILERSIVSALSTLRAESLKTF